MKPKMQKKLGNIVIGMLIGAVVLAAVAVYISRIGVRKEFLRHKELAVEYVMREYGSDCVLVNERTGRKSFQTPREPDVFAFFHTELEIYFTIQCYEGQIADYYDEFTFEKPDLSY